MKKTVVTDGFELMERHQGGFYILSNPSMHQPLVPASFDANILRQRGDIESRADGRGSAWFIRLGEDSAVLRHYYRGGLMAKISNDSFVWSGIQKSRAFLEYRLLGWMQQAGLPVPQPLGALVVRKGWRYQCDLITRTIPDTCTLADTLARESLPETVWQELGVVIRQMHDIGVWHADLNAKNILLDSKGAVSLIDFDRCRRREGEGWKQRNLQRLRRSLDKLMALGQIRHCTAADWQVLLRGYQRK